jgi:hypothetical protein
MPLDPLRKDFLTTISKLGRTEMKKGIADDAKLSDDQKKTDGDLVDLAYDIVDDIGVLGFFNGIVRSWSNADGTLTSVAAGQIPVGARKKFEDLLTKFAGRDPKQNLQNAADTEGDVEIHLLTVPDVHKEYPEFIGKDGEVYVGITDKTVWLASGDKSLARLKKAIQEAAASGPKASPGVDLFLKFAPFVESRDKYRQRNPVVAVKAVVDEARPKGAAAAEPKKKVTAKVEGIISGADLRKIALDTFTDDKDTMTASLDRQGKIVNVQVQFDETLIRYVGKIISKIVKENLADE